MADSAFSENGNYYCAISSDGRLKIWDTETNVLKQEYTPDLHLTSPATCLKWITVSTSGHIQKNKRNSINGIDSECIALGTSSGRILLYSVAQAKVESILFDEKNSQIHNSSVTCLDWHPEYGLYSCNKGNYLQNWDIQSGSIRNKYNVSIDNKKQCVCAMKIVPNKQKTPATFVVTASWQVCVWRLHNTEATIIKQLGHNATPHTNILTVASLKKTSWLIEGSQNERLLSFWDITISNDSIPLQNGDGPTPKRQRKKSLTAQTITAPTYNFVLEDAPKAIDVDVREVEEGVRLSLAAVTRSGVVHYYGHMLNGSSSKPIKPSVTLQVTSATAEPLPAVCCRVDDQQLHVGYSQQQAIVFERITPDLTTKTQVLIRGDTKAKRSKHDKNKISMEPTEVTYVEPLGGVVRKRPTPGATVEAPMEARLANLSVDVSSAKSPVHHNLTRLLMQGLHSHDKSMVLMVLQRNDPAVAFRTVSKLPADCIPALLDALVDMASRKTSQCSFVTTWLSALLRTHSALLLATASASNCQQLMQLMAVFTHRRSHLCQLLNLKGRLELTTALRENSNKPSTQEAVLEYNDTSSEDEDAMEVQHSDSEHMFSEHEDDSRNDSGSDVEGD